MKRDLTIGAIAIVLTAGICYGIAAMRPSLKATLPQPFSEHTGATTTGPNAETIVMRVNGEPVTDREFAVFGASLPQQAQMYLQSAEGRRIVAEQYARMKVLEQEGKRLGADDDPEVAAKMKFGRTNVAVEYAIGKLGAQTPDATLRAEYDKNKKEFDTADLSHIVIGYQGSKIPSRNKNVPTREQAVALAKQVEDKLRGGAPFEQLAAAVSDDTQSAGSGGRLGMVPVSQLPPELQAAVSPLKAGQISGPVVSQFGVHIFKVNDRKTQSYEEVKPMLQQRLQQTTVKDAVDRLAKAAKIEYDPKFFPDKLAAGHPKQ
jgi:hypothetical protein